MSKKSQKKKKIKLTRYELDKMELEAIRKQAENTFVVGPAAQKQKYGTRNN